ncbi:M50 family metallopeptidase [Actinokineospora sp.]|uniref:M50 family metallopeptidase n=1 Tax=Actinokineospora sp. TaxID=1872133 RepID=UPI004037AD6C
MTDARTAARPTLRPEVIFGPAQRRDDALVHHVKDRRTNRVYRLGEKEFFVVSRMDGRHTAADIEHAYADHYGRMLGPQSWRQIFTMLGARQLMAGEVDEQELARLRQEGDTASRRSSLLQRRFVLVNPDRWLSVLARRLSWLFSPFFVLPGAALAVALVVLVAVRAEDMVADFATGGRWAALPLSFPVTWLVIALHECAHGLACKHFGGTVREIGLLWRFPIFAPFCNTEDTRFFPRRRERVYTAFAGVFTSLLAMVPFALWWLSAEPDSWWRGAAASIVLFGTAGALMNLIPFLQMDGYHMINHALGMDDLRRQSYRYWAWLVVHRRRGQSRSYRAADHAAYVGYGVATAVFLAALAWFLVGLWYVTLTSWVGPAAAAAILTAEVGLAAAFVAYARVRSARAERSTG